MNRGGFCGGGELRAVGDFGVGEGDCGTANSASGAGIDCGVFDCR